MKTLRELVEENLSDLLKDKHIDNYIDPSIADDVKVKILGEVYNIKNFGNNILANIKAKVDYNIFTISKNKYFTVDKDTVKSILTNPYDKEYPCIFNDNGVEVKTKIKLLKNVTESIITEKGNDEGNGSLLNVGIMSVVGALIGGPIGLAVCAGIACFLNPTTIGVLGAGAAGLFSNLFNSKDKGSKDSKDSKDSDSSKSSQTSNDSGDMPNPTSDERTATFKQTLAMAAAQCNKLSNNEENDKIKANFDKFMNEITDEHGNIDEAKLSDAFNNPDNKDFLKNLQDTYDKSKDSMDSFVKEAHEVSPDSIKKLEDYMKEIKSIAIENKNLDDEEESLNKEIESTNADKETAQNDLTEKQNKLNDTKKKLEDPNLNDEDKRALEDTINQLEKEVNDSQKAFNDIEKKSNQLTEKKNNIEKKRKELNDRKEKSQKAFNDSISVSRIKSPGEKAAGATENEPEPGNESEPGNEPGNESEPGKGDPNDSNTDDDDEEIPLIKDDGTKDENKTYIKKVADDGSIKYIMKSGDEETDISKDEFEKNKENAIKAGEYKDDREDDSNGEDENDDDLDADDNDADAEEIVDKDGNKKRVIKNPAKIWHRKKKKNGKGVTKSYYNSKGDSISSDEFKNKMNAFKEKKAKKANSTGTNLVASGSEPKNESIVGRLRTLREMRLKYK